jgi:hypothetical protein
VSSVVLKTREVVEGLPREIKKYIAILFSYNLLAENRNKE